MNITSATFITSCLTLKETRRLTWPAVSFVWRSNVWKSSLINMLVWQKDMAKTSSKPWKTQTINYFLINDNRHLVDVPWYWYAKKSIEERINRMDTLEKFLTKNNNLRMTYVLIDATIPFSKYDALFLETLINEWVRMSIILTKIDKAKNSFIQKNKTDIQNFCNDLGQRWLKIFEVSSKKSLWKEKILTHIESCIKEDDFPLLWEDTDKKNDDISEENTNEKNNNTKKKNIRSEALAQKLGLV